MTAIETLLPWGTAFLAFGCMLLLTPLVIRLAHRMDWLAYPKADRWHAKPTALMGGIAIYGAATIAYAFTLADGSTLSWMVWLGGTIMFVTGLVDDLIDIKPTIKLIAQIVATGVLLLAGYSFAPQWPFWISIPITFIWVIGITNALNLLDNMDGLAAGVAGIAAVTLAIFSVMAGEASAQGAELAVAGAAIGFLVFNFKPARIFMGDSGSLFLGYLIAALSIVIQAETVNTSPFGIYLVSVIVLAVPIFDTSLVTVVRSLAGRPISQGGRDHSSHRLVQLGLSERMAVLTLYGICILFGGIALTFHFTSPLLFYALLILIVSALVVFGRYLGSIDVYAESTVEVENLSLLQRVVSAPKRYLGANWKAPFGVLADLLLITSAFTIAYFLRFEQGITPEREAFLVEVLPVVVSIKLVVFYVMGMYRSIWRYAGTPEMVKLVKATIIASAIVYIAMVLLFGFKITSKGVAVIDWMITFIAVSGIRFSFRGLRQYISTLGRSGPRIVLYGAGDAGMLSLRELRQNEKLALTPVGFIDDDPLKQGQYMQGLQVLGGLEELADICSAFKIQEVLITAFDMPEERQQRVVSVCREAGIPCRRLQLRFEPLRSSMEEVESQQQRTEEVVDTAA